MRIGKLYAAGRERITELVSQLSQEDAARAVPACPAWTVQDLVAHLAGVSADILAGNLEGLTTEPWTQAQVDARRDRGMGELLAEWAEAGPQVEALSVHFPEFVGTQWLLDVTTHEQDLRGALGTPGARDTEALRHVLAFLVREGLSASLRVRGLPTLEVRAGDLVIPAGDGPAAAVLEAEPFELLRALTGRRSERQIAALGWSADPAPYLPAFTFGPFKPAQEDIDE